MNQNVTYRKIYCQKLLFRLMGKAIYQPYAKRLPLNGTEQVLDFGCSPISYYLSKSLPRGQIECMSTSLRWLNTCKRMFKNCSNISFKQCELIKKAFPQANYDFIFCDYVFFKLPDFEVINIIHILVNLLKPSGLIAFREPLKDLTKYNLIQEYMNKLGLSKKEIRITDLPILGNTIECIYINQ